MLPQRHPGGLRPTTEALCCRDVNEKTLVDLICESGRCGRDEGMRRLFRRSLHLHARPLLPFMRLLCPGYFELDRELVAQVARARSMREVDEELRHYADDLRNRDWWRRHGRVRVSAKRLRQEARHVLGRSGRR